jgi:hypothetical protein
MTTTSPPLLRWIIQEAATPEDSSFVPTAENGFHVVRRCILMVIPKLGVVCAGTGERE